MSEPNHREIIRKTLKGLIQAEIGLAFLETRKETLGWADWSPRDEASLQQMTQSRDVLMDGLLDALGVQDG